MYKIIFSILLAACLISGCKKDPAMVGPTDKYSTASYPKSFDDLNSAVTACYSNLRDQYLYGFDFLPKVMANATHVSDAAYTDPDWVGFSNPTAINPSNGFVTGAWQALFAGVKNCNVALSAADFYESNYAAPAEKTQIDYVRGQAYFLRAYYYFMLENLFGEDYVPSPTATDTLGVPIFSGIPATYQDAQQPRSSITAVWNLIESDLQKAADLLKGQVWPASDQARATEWAAKALLGKAYVFRKEYAKAAPVLKDVIDNSGKSLMPYKNYRNSFIGIDINGNSVDEFNSESLFELNVDQNAMGGYGVFSGVANATTINGLIWPPYALGEDGTEATSQPLGYGGNDGFHDKNVLRFGFNLGTYNLVNNPDFDASKPASYTNPKMVMDPVYKQKSLAARTNHTVDPRLYVSAMQPWLDSVRLKDKNGVLAWHPVARPGYLQGDPNFAEEYGWSFRKYAPIYNTMDAVGDADACNIYLLRLADVYLLYAEASMHNGDNATALNYLNKIRRRAYGLDPNTTSALDYKSLTDATPAAVSNDPVLGHNPLYYERWAELFNEGQWWFDMCRWHLGASEAAYYGSVRTVKGALQWDDKSYAWPIPLAEINSNPKITTADQNPGY